MFFQKLKHRARECASVRLYCTVTAYLHQRMTCYRDSSYQVSAFSDRELTNFPNVGGARKGIQCCVLLFRRSVTNRVFAVCQMPEFHGQHASVMFSSFSSLRTLIRTRCVDVTNGLDLGLKGFVKGAQGALKCSLSLACEVCGCANFSRPMQLFIPPQFNVSTIQGAYWWSKQRCNACCTTERSSCEHGA